MDAIVFFLPVALVIAQYLIPSRKSQSEISRVSAGTGSCCA
jgi:hypothetical protein